MNGKNDDLDLCSVGTFAQLCDLPIEEVIGCVDSGTIPSIKLADFRMVNLARLRDDLDKGKTTFSKGDYFND